MTLLESLIALVILGLAATGFLELFQTTSRSTRDAAQWVEAVSYAEASMEESKLSGIVMGGRAGAPADFSRTITVHPWPGAPGVNQVTVTVSLPGGASFVLQRLVRAP